ncbi:MAG: ribosomal RNA small subunit methyltransferase A [Deltaproteobacteria bacterium]|nr:ribosomal RNA small subunit methyltransferase A [Deltaproteobacteria bacterium]
MNFQHPNALRKRFDFIAKKSFGQNFLVHTPTLKTLSEKILRLKPKTILEIGPGPGSLTQWLLPEVEQMIVVEKDAQFSTLLKEILSPAEKVKIILADFLDCDLTEILKDCPSPLFAVGNLPYHVSVAILKKLLEHRSFFSQFFLMFQKEVAERLCAKPNSKAYGSLSLYTQFLASAKILLPIPPSSFDPRPKIDSAVVQLSPYPTSLCPELELSFFEKLIQAAFSQRRKTLLNCLCANGFFEGNKERATQHLNPLGLSGKERAESLDLATFIKLALSFF